MLSVRGNLEGWFLSKEQLQFGAYQRAIATVQRLKKRSYLNDAEQVEYDKADAQVRFLAEKLGSLSDPDEFERWLSEPQGEAVRMNPQDYGPNGEQRQTEQADRKPGGPFRSLGEQLQSIAAAGMPGSRPDSRLWDVRGVNASGAQEAVPSEGGFLVQSDFANEIWRAAFQRSNLASLVRRMQVGDRSNTIKLPAFDETSRATGSRFGGLQLYWKDEAETLAGSKPKFREMEFTLNKLTGLFYATDELIQDASILEQVFREAFTAEVAWVVDNCIIRGTGAGQPLGILNSDSLIEISKEDGQAGTTFVLENAVKMWSRLLPNHRQDALWLVNTDVEPQLYTMSLAVGTGGSAVFLPGGNVSGTPYASLFGRPVIPIEQASTLGTVGDVVLFSPSGYLLADKAMRLDSSMHVRFINDEMTYRIVYRLDGQPLLNSAITPANGSNTQSTQVVVESRS